MTTTTERNQAASLAILDQAADAVIFADVEHVIRFRNAAAAQKRSRRQHFEAHAAQADKPEKP